MDSLLSVRYALYPDEQWNRTELSFVGQSGDVWLYEIPVFCRWAS